MGNLCFKDEFGEKYAGLCDESSVSHSTDYANKPSPLNNIGTNCYLNSVLQGISASNKFVEDIKTLKLQYTDLYKLSFFTNLIENVHLGNQKLRDISQNQIFKNWNKTGEQDSFELLSYVLNQVYNEIRDYLESKEEIEKRSIKEWLKILLPMRILISYEIHCECKNIINISLQSELALHVPIVSLKKPIDLQNLINDFYKGNPIVGYECYTSGCKGKEATKYTKLCKPLPRTICLHLQRTSWNGRCMKKINVNVNFPEILIISAGYYKDKIVNYNDSCVLYGAEIQCSNNETDFHRIAHQFVESIIKESIKIINTQNDSIHSQTNEDEQYQLISVIVHSGTVSGGHYVCYKKMMDKWFLTNDSRIKAVKKEKVFASQAYLLFYEKSK